MTVFYLTLISTFILALSARVFGEKYKINWWIFTAALILIFILVAGLRNNIGDTEQYVHSYNLLNEFTGFSDDAKDKGFTIFQLFLYNISNDPQFFIFVTSLITQLFNVITLVIYKSYFELEVYMYITSGCFLVSMNGIRQAMVGAILFFCSRLIIKGKFIPYAIIVAILSTMHSSALMMIPVYFVVREEAWSKRTKIIIGLAAIGFMFFYELMPAVFDAMGDSSYTEYEEAMLNGGGGSSLMRVIVNAVPVVMAYIFRDKLKESWPESNVFVNMSLINLIFVTFALYNWIFARFQIYFQLYNFVLLPYMIKNCFERRQERDFVYYCFIICYFVFFYYEQVIGGVGLGYRSNFIDIN